MTVLVTGGAGFIASYVVDILIDNEIDVVIADNLSHGNLKNINPRAKFYECDLLSPDFEKIFQENDIKYVSHHAAQSSVSYSNKCSVKDAESNIIASLILIELCKKYNIQKIIAASTAAVYGFPEYLPVDEKHPVKVLSNYGLSKHTMEQYIKISGLDYIIFRYSNVYGPRQNSTGEAGVVAIYTDKLLDGKSVEIHGDGEQTRDFIFVQDVAKANLKAILSNVKNEIINISTSTSLSINNLYNSLNKILNTNLEPIHTEERQGDIKHSSLNNKKAEVLLNWHSEVPIEQGLLKTVNFFKTV
jgi:UDP-glucose 4-epimerase